MRFGQFSRIYPERTRKNHDNLIALYEAGQLNPYVGKTYPLVDAVDALDALKSRQITGKVILVI